jgi:hypothetical protein
MRIKKPNYKTRLLQSQLDYNNAVRKTDVSRTKTRATANKTINAILNWND